MARAQSPEGGWYYTAKGDEDEPDAVRSTPQSLARDGFGEDPQFAAGHCHGDHAVEATGRDPRRDDGARAAAARAGEPCPTLPCACHDFAARNDAHDVNVDALREGLVALERRPFARQVDLGDVFGSEAHHVRIADAHEDGAAVFDVPLPRFARQPCGDQ